MTSLPIRDTSMRTPGRIWVATSLVVSLCCWLSTPAAESGTGVASISGTASAVLPTSPAVDEGMTMRVAGSKVAVSPGKCWVNDRPVQITSETLLEVEPAPTTTVHDQALEMSSDVLANLASKTILADLRAAPSDPVPLAGLLIPGSLRVKASKIPGAPLLKKGGDYVVDERWGAVAFVAGGSIKKGQIVYVDYKYAGKRIDTLVVSENGKLSLIRGTPAKSAPMPPAIPAGVVPVANVYVVPSATGSCVLEILPITTLQPLPMPAEIRETNRKALTRSLAMLKSGDAINIAFWGDSITGGSDASSPDKVFTNQVIAGLRKRFPTARISTFNAGVGGTNTRMRLPGFESEVLSKKPDLVILEFVNDMNLPTAELEANYEKIVGMTKNAGAELIMCTPHHATPVIMRVPTWQAVAAKPYIALVKHTATRSQVGLADVAARWNGLRREGLRPDLMLVDEIIHPNDRGHTIYAEELLKCFE